MSATPRVVYLGLAVGLSLLAGGFSATYSANPPVTSDTCRRAESFLISVSVQEMCRNAQSAVSARSAATRSGRSRCRP